jgi:hypothetical protein
MLGAGDPGDLSLEPGQEAAMIEMSPAPGGDMIIDRGPAVAFGTTEDGVASMCEPDIDPVLLGVESDAFNPPGLWQGQESREESDVAHGQAAEG